MESELDTTRLKPGAYWLAVTQQDGKTTDVPIRVQPPPPVISSLPLKANTGEAEQRITLRGSGLDRVTAVECEHAHITLDPASQPGERRGVVRLKEDASAGTRASLRVHVEGMQEPLEIADGFEVRGPRPRIEASRVSLPDDLGVAVREGELPVQVLATVELNVANAGDAPALRLGCRGGSTILLRAGEERAGPRLRVTAPGSLFVSLDPAAVGQPGCTVEAMLESAESGQSDARPLGRIIRLPRIESFQLTDEQVAPGIYAGVLKGGELEMIEKIGWDNREGARVTALPKAAGASGRQTLAVAVTWPAPRPHAPIFIWLRGETEGRATNARF
jgi:hypothetical protein